ncbi:MAG: peptidoglycan bridge formation glycyltransferase FemA/FemB family protein [Candidatus Magasanikbacteria bacterium]|nr:peptidoglycan bridge formation glycyltransferase FemA/FemB family protein [Candidatus Magasanikbacteria bacterium]
MIKIIEILDKKMWENFVLEQENTLFVQSWKYGEFYKKINERYWIFGIFDDNKLVGGSLVLSTHAKRGNYLYLPYGPIMSKKINAEYLKKFSKFLRQFAMKNKFDFVRLSPFIDDTEKNREIFKNAGFKKSPIHALAENTWLLDLNKTEEELLADMKKNHRNLVNRCLKKDVKIVKTKDPKELKDFNRIHDETAKRHNFHRFPDDYVENEFKIFAGNDQALLIKAYLPSGELDSAAIFIYYGNMSAYRHSGSLNLDKKLPTSYLIQWEAIQEALKRGIKIHNFWGVAPDNAGKKHPFRGITHFKKGFGGYQKDLLPCHDLPVSNRYYFAWLIETIRRIRRGF